MQTSAAKVSQGDRTADLRANHQKDVVAQSRWKLGADVQQCYGGDGGCRPGKGRGQNVDRVTLFGPILCNAGCQNGLQLCPKA
jgi:hypothetical protein